ncbi:MAG: hypothetical protein PHX83_17455 [Acidobacteriia bacterium]|nr:hypothetical protein [Terriglobia bacterium]
MPEAKEPEVVETSVDNLLVKASKLKKAGLPTAAVVLIAAMGFPGFWEYFDNTDEEAKVKAEVAYQLLKAQSEAQMKQLAYYRAEMNDLRSVVNSMLLQRPVVGGTPRSLPEVISAPSPLRLPESLENVEDTAVGQAAMASAGLDDNTM